MHVSSTQAVLPAQNLPPSAHAAGVVKYGQPLSLDDKLRVDLIVVGSVAVDPETGCRWAGGQVAGRAGLENSWVCPGGKAGAPLH